MTHLKHVPEDLNSHGMVNEAEMRLAESWYDMQPCDRIKKLEDAKEWIGLAIETARVEWEQQRKGVIEGRI